ncbi:hypothetical protein [Pseudoxanthomonas sp.]|jgi:hypothetical protein|uniref:hypothetical protein n=1 Tax=Pseudoxanthomonas sp. TaxID=1871049 RepID=UPI002E1419C1|nr:hypothetical protein [Pseudoxanthomonas sp.]
MSRQVDYRLYDLARSAILTRMSGLGHEQEKARQRQENAQVDEFRAKKLALWVELQELTPREPKICAAVVSKYSTDMLRAQRVLNHLKNLQTP